jgi:hypothetical protein
MTVYPVLLSVAAIGPLAMLADEAFEAYSAGCAERVGADLI